MNPTQQILALAAVSGYLLGSIPFGYLLVRAFLKQDVRSSGSGNIGATNVARKSPKLGLMTLLLDALKGFAAVWIASQFGDGDPTSASSLLPMSVAALAAVVGSAMLVAASSSPSPAFTLSSPSGEQQVLHADIQDKERCAGRPCCAPCP